MKKKYLFSIFLCAACVFMLTGCAKKVNIAGGNTNTDATEDTGSDAENEDQESAEDTAEDTNVKYETMYVVNCHESITLRSSASSKASEIMQIPFGAAVSFISAADNGFYKIIYNGHEGYALSDYLDYTKQETPAPAADTTDDNANKSYKTMYVVNCRESITLRKSDSSGASEIMQIPLGAAVSYISGADNGFYKISYNGHTGYALSSYLSETKQTQTTSSSVSESGGQAATTEAASVQTDKKQNTSEKTTSISLAGTIWLNKDSTCTGTSYGVYFKDDTNFEIDNGARAHYCGTYTIHGNEIDFVYKIFGGGQAADDITSVHEEYDDNDVDLTAYYNESDNTITVKEYEDITLVPDYDINNYYTEMGEHPMNIIDWVFDN